MGRLLKKSTAGERVGALVDALSDSLLGDEEDARALMEAVFVGGMGPAADALQLAHGAPGLAGHAEVLLKVREALQGAIAATQGPFATLVRDAVGKALESMREELGVCERTVASRYAGIGARAVTATRRGSQQLVEVALAQYAGNAQTVTDWFSQQLEVELRVSRQEGEDLETLLSRLISPTPVRLGSHSGRGLWWKGLEHCHRVTREVEIAAVNAVRTEAMMAFNRLAEEVDHGAAVQAG